MSSLLSIDFDFFVPHGMYENVKFPNGTTYPGMLVYDWQMNEGRAPEFDQALWHSRAANFQRNGLDLQALTELPVSISDFSLRVSSRMNDAAPGLWRGDSHAWAGLLAKDYSEIYGPLSVINFDAHHDLGYEGKASLDKFHKSGSIHCDDWALIGLEKGWIENYTIVYPDWLGRKEWAGWKNKPMLKPFKSKIEITTWSEWDGEIPDAEVGFFCRSSSWVPPWKDELFKELHEEFGWAECLDCLHGQSNSPYDTCETREWDWEAVAEEVRQTNEIYVNLRKLNDPSNRAA